MLVERYSYDVFGRPTIRDPNGVVIQQSVLGNPYLFTGRAWDSETALYYYRARYYDYFTGRFLQPDPTGYADGLNLYSYCGNNPSNFLDPTGLCKELARGFGWRSVRNGLIVVGVIAVVGVAVVACPGAVAVVGAVMAKVGPALAIAGGVMGGAMLAPTITGYDYAGNDLSMYQRGEWLSDAGFTIGGALYGAAKIPAAGPASGGRLGSPGTRAHVAHVTQQLKGRGYQITRGGGMFPEEYLPGPTGRLSSNYVDITAMKNGHTLRINTIDTLVDGVTPTAREAASAAAIRAKTPGDHLLLIPKPR